MKYSQKKSPKVLRSKKVLLLLTSLVIITGLVGILLYQKGYFLSTQKPAPQSDQREDKKIDLSPPTEQEQAAGDQRKKDIVANEQQGALPQPDSQTKTATVIITDAGQYDNVIEVRSFIPDHYQDGTCTITLRQGTQVITKEAPAYRDATTTICTNPMIQRSELPAAGNWQVTVAYASAGANGLSEVKTIKID